MGGEGGEGGALAEGRRCPCEACGSAAAAGGALTWHSARVSSRHVGRGRCALRLGRAGAGGRSLRAGHRAGGRGMERRRSGKVERRKQRKEARRRPSLSLLHLHSRIALPPPWPTSQSQRPSTTTSRRTQTPNSPSMKTTSSTSSTRRTTSESHTFHSHSHTLTPCSWWKAKLKDDAGGADGQVGLVPATYVEEVSPSVHPSIHPSMPLSWATSRRFTRASRTCMRSSSSPGNTVASHPSLGRDCGCTRNHVPRNNVA